MCSSITINMHSSFIQNNYRYNFSALTECSFMEKCVAFAGVCRCSMGVCIPEDRNQDVVVGVRIASDLWPRCQRAICRQALLLGTPNYMPSTNFPTTPNISSCWPFKHLVQQICYPNCCKYLKLPLCNWVYGELKFCIILRGPSDKREPQIVCACRYPGLCHLCPLFVPSILHLGTL